MSRIMKTMVSFAIVNLILVCCAVYAQAQLKLGYIRSDYIFSNYEPYKAAQKQLDEFQTQEYDKLQKMKIELDEKAQDAQAKEILMTPEMKESKLQELMKQQEDLDRSYQELVDPQNGTMIKKQNELMQPVINNINEVLMRIAKNDEYDFIFDATVDGGGTVLYANEKYDISDEILEELKKDISSQ